MISRWTVCGFFVVALSAGPAEARRHYGIITGLTNSPKELASIDVVTEDASLLNIGYMFRVFINGLPAQSDPPLSSAVSGSFVSSTSSSIPNLFTPSSGQTALVSVDTVDMQTLGPLSIPSWAVLRQRSGTSRILTSLPSQQASVAQLFHAPVGSLEAGTWLFVAAIDVDTSIWVVTNDTPPTGDPIPIPAFGVLKIPVTTPNSRITVRVAAKADGTVNPSEHIMVLLAVDSGNKVEQTILPPAGL